MTHESPGSPSGPASGSTPSLVDPALLLAERFRTAILEAFPALAGQEIDPLVAPSRQLDFGDFQCNAAMSLAKRVGGKPRDVALAIVDKVRIDDVAEPLTQASVAGPGFINIRLKGAALASMLASMDAPGLGVLQSEANQRTVVDLCGVNLAKQMHVGHLRSIIIGDAIARTLTRLGGTVIRQNHVGDWGLPIAMVTRALMQRRDQGLDLSTLTLDQLERAYRGAQKACEADEAGLAAAQRFGLGPKAIAELEAQVLGAREELAAAKRTLVALQAHDPRTVEVWKQISEITMRECLAICARLNTIVTAEHSAGESAYAEALAPMVRALESSGVAELSDGALVIRLDAPQDGGIAEPCLVRKSDGGFLYATTDLAAIRHRVQTLHATRVVYCVDARQALHFRQVFAAAKKAGFASTPTGTASLQHAAFGTVLGEDGRPFKTRSGDNVKLADLLDEAQSRALDAVTQRDPDRPLEERVASARAIGIAALKYADLSSDRVKDYVFSFQRMLAFEGNTGPYLLYALVRIRSIFRKAAERGVGDQWRAAPLSIDDPAEKLLAMALVRYPGVVAGVGVSLEPHRLCQYLYELAQAFSVFFDRCPVLQASAEARDARLRLCDLAARVLEDGLSVLGIPTLERM